MKSNATMAPISVGIVLLFSIQFLSSSAVGTPSVLKSQFRPAFIDFYACVIQCYKDSFPVRCIQGDLCIGDSEIAPKHQGGRIAFKQVKKSFYCITKTCNIKVSKYLCDLNPLNNSSSGSGQSLAIAKAESQSSAIANAGSQSSAIAKAGSQSSAITNAGSQSSAIAKAESQSNAQTYDYWSFPSANNRNDDDDSNCDDDKCEYYCDDNCEDDCDDNCEDDCDDNNDDCNDNCEYYCDDVDSCDDQAGASQSSAAANSQTNSQGSQTWAEASSSSGSYANSGNDDQSVLSLSKSFAQGSTGSLSNGKPNYNNLYSPTVNTDNNWGSQQNIYKPYSSGNINFGRFFPPGSKPITYPLIWPGSGNSWLPNNGWIPSKVQSFPDQTQVFNYNNRYNSNPYISNSAPSYPKMPNYQDEKTPPGINQESIRKTAYSQNQLNNGQSIVQASYPSHSLQTGSVPVIPQSSPLFSYSQGGSLPLISTSRVVTNNDQLSSGVPSQANSNAFSISNDGSNTLTLVQQPRQNQIPFFGAIPRGNTPTWVQQFRQNTPAYSGDNIESNKQSVQKNTSNLQQNIK